MMYTTFTGRLFHSCTIRLDACFTTRLPFDLGFLRAGIYVAEVTTRDATFTQKIIN